MTTEQPRDFVVVDTSVLTYIARRSPEGRRYSEMLEGWTIGLCETARDELEAANWDPATRARLNALYEECVHLAPGAATESWYGRCDDMRRQLGMGLRTVGRADLRIIAHAAEHDAPYMSHDRLACEVALALGIEVLTALAD